MIEVSTSSKQHIKKMNTQNGLVSRIKAGWFCLVFAILAGIFFLHDGKAQLGANWSNDFQPRSEGLAEAYELVPECEDLSGHQVEELKLEAKAMKWLNEISKNAGILAKKEILSIVYQCEGQKTFDHFMLHSFKDPQGSIDWAMVNLSTSAEKRELVDDFEQTDIIDMFFFKILENNPICPEREFSAELRILDVNKNFVVIDFHPFNSDLKDQWKKAGRIDDKLSMNYLDKPGGVEWTIHEGWRLMESHLKHAAFCLKAAIATLEKEEHEFNVNKHTISHKRLR